ncbi:hypothetical protein CU102_12675 [Phyllobacterium brassicacearum]|uniref:DUF2280 domain-containing protein n=1 Tax=Phyllobacterium brassicacearum TaxID=314235 RepID=A0A2P7BQ77_9HYPH|nr:DUF2280 domain-containing protein [Phyllobacterium brassicacearum]PSH68610.1 hypothetical protein CU102_12675 [Phyllobacterium brassicacearum]TDQ24157.1 hypothetical protein DEV91_11535 [Phyllobacterium brassicacearum]
MANPKYSDDVKTRVVQCLACFDPPSVVVKSIKADFGIDISAQAVETYDPNKVAGKRLSKRFRELFEATRKAFLEDTATIAISHRAVRLRALQRMAEKAETQGNMVLAASLMEQAAKEVGDSFTNRRALVGADGGPVEVRTLADFYGNIKPGAS